MGEQLDALFDMIEGHGKNDFRHQHVIVEHKWNGGAASFEEITH